MSYKPLLLVTAPVQTRSGYGAHARDIVRSLIDIDKFDIKIFPVRWGNTSWDALDKNDPNDKKILDLCLSQPNLDRQPDIHIHIVVPNEFQPIGKYNIGITAGIETTACPVDWIQGLNRMDMNIVPSVHAKDIFNSVVFDTDNAFASNTFTAPVTGKYQLNTSIRLTAADTAANAYLFRLNGSNRAPIANYDGNQYATDTEITVQLSALLDMDANDTVTVEVYQDGGTAQTDIQNGEYSFFNGILVG